MLSREVARQEEKAAAYEARAKEYRQAGRDDAGLLARAQGYRSTAERLRQEYSSMAGNLGDGGYRQALRDAPKAYNESRLRERSYDPGGVGPGRSESRSYFQAKELAAKQPGVYEYKTGGAFVSSAGDGSFYNQRGEFIEIRSPVGQRSDKSFIYAPKNERTITGLVITGESGQAVRQAAESGKYATVGSLFAGVTAPALAASFGPLPSSAMGLSSRVRSGLVGFGQGEPGFFGGAKRLSAAGYVGLFAASDAQSRAAEGSKNPNRSLYSNPLNTTSFNAFVDRGNNVPFYLNPTAKLTGGVAKSAFGVASGVVDFPNEAVKDPYGSARKASIVTGLSYVGGEVVGGVVSKVATRSVVKAGFIDKGVKTVLGGALAYQTATNPVSVGREAPYIALGGVAFQAGASRLNPPPKVEYSFGKVTSTKGRSYGEQGEFFTLEGSGRARVAVTRYGETKVRYPKYVTELESSSKNVYGDLLISGNSKVQSGKVLGIRYGGVRDSFTGVLRTPSPPGVEFPGGRSGLLGVRFGNGRFSQTEFYPSSMFEKSAPYKSFTGTLAYRNTQFNVVGRGVRSTSITEGSSLLEFNPLPRRQRFIPYSGFERFETSFGPIETNRPAGLSTSPFDIGYLTGRSLKVSRTGVDNQFYDPVVGVKSFGLLRRAGLYRENLRTRSFIKANELREQFSASLFPRKNTRLYSGFALEQTGLRSPNGILEPPIRGSARIAPPLEGITPFVRSGFVGSSFSFLPAYSFASRSSFSTPRVKATPLSASTQNVVYRPVTVNAIKVSQSPSFDTAFRSSLRQENILKIEPVSNAYPIIQPPTNVPSPEFPGVPGFGVPLFGVGGGRSVSGIGRSRRFKYAPSLNAVLFNIKGRKENKRLTGFETRPILTR